MTSTYQDVRNAVRDAAAIRTITLLQPAGGAGDKVFPPTYAVSDHAKTKYAVETRRIDGDEVQTVLLDSVASQANRMELALLNAWREGELLLPVVQVDFSGEEGLEDLDIITSLEAPHRIADALLRDSVLDGVPFRTTAIGHSFTDARPGAATSMYTVCPHALIFGIWDSTGPKGGLGAKFQRTLVSEVIAIGAVSGVKTASRLDPASIQKGVPVYVSKDDPETWEVDEAEAAMKKGKPETFKKEGKPSEINHGNIAPSIDTQAGGITFDRAQQTTVLSLTGLRQLRFPVNGNGDRLAGTALRDGQLSARTALATLALAAVVLARRDGYHLRSRALLIPDGPMVFELIDSDGQSTTFSLSVQDALALHEEATTRAAADGFPWEGEAVTLLPAPKLASLIRKSRALASTSSVEED